jgi:hypothetical protein
MAAIAGAGVIFQGGIGWATLDQIRGDRKKNEARDAQLTQIDKKVDQHEWRITSHDTRLHLHDEQIEKLKGKT